MRRQFLGVIALAFVFLAGSSAMAAMKSSNKNGVQREYFDNGQPRLELRYKNGLLYRKRAFYRNGRVKLDYRYRGHEAVKMVNFYENGKLESIWTKKSGVTKYYHPNGELRVEVDNNKNNINKGLKSSYIFSNGN